MKYLKKFSTHSDYATFTGGTDFILPNVSYCENEDEVHFNQIDPHEYVDLGLPSGTLWATENIKDANGNELYFAWGETQGYTSGQVGTDKNFNWNDYGFGTRTNLTKYNSTDGKTVLDSEDDAATANWGSNWKMPTMAQFQELAANTTFVWTQIDGVNGLLCTSTVNTNTLFFPAIGYAKSGEVHDVGGNEDIVGYYWSASLDDNNVVIACFANLGDAGWGMSDSNRNYGYSVRPVHSSN